MSAEPPTGAVAAVAANPRHPHHPGYRTGLAVVVAILVVMFAGSAVGTAFKSTIAIINLVGLLVVGFFAAGTYILVLAFSLHDAQRRHRRIRVASIVLGVALLLWMLVVASIVAGLNVVGAIISIPTTGFAVWLLRHVNRNQKEPWRLLLAAFGWGGVVAVNLAILLEGPFDRFFTRVLIPGPGQGLSASFSAALFEEVPKGLAVLLLYLVMRNEFDDVVDGIVYGAVVGLGFNFVEGLGYMAAHGLVGQFYVRQILGLFTGHTTYTALIGAGMGVARQQTVAWKRVLAIASGFTTAVAAHFLWDALAMTSFLPRSSSAALEVPSSCPQGGVHRRPLHSAGAAAALPGAEARGADHPRAAERRSGPGPGHGAPRGGADPVQPASPRPAAPQGVPGLWLARL